MIDEINSLTSQRSKLIEQVINNLALKVTSAQSGLLDNLVSDFLDKMDVKDGVILNNEKNKRLLSLLDQTFQSFNAQHGIEAVKAITDGVQKIVDFNSQYFGLFTQPAAIKPITQDAKGLVLQWLGIDNSGKAVANGYLDTLVKDNRIKNDVRNLAVKAIVGQTGWFELKKQTGDYIKGKPGETGALDKYYRNFTYDLFSQVDRANNQVYADKLGLDYAIYEGGIIKTTRPFCRERNGEVFTREEIAQFNPPTAKPPGYNPFTDLGGYGCRHHLNWVPYAVAVALRPDLKKDKGPEAKTPPIPVKPKPNPKPTPVPPTPAPPEVKAEPKPKAGARVKAGSDGPFNNVITANQFKTTVEQTIEKNLGFKPGAVNASFASLPKEQAIRYGNQLAALTGDYEIFKGMDRIDQITFKSGGGKNGYLAPLQGGIGAKELNFGNNFDKGQKDRAFDPKAREARFKSRVDAENYEVATLTHEFGHLITIDYQATNRGNALDSRIIPFWDEINKLRQAYHKELSEVFPNKQKFIALSLGKYASANANEFMAEGFTEYKLSKNPSKYAVLIGQTIDKYFKTKNK